MKKILVMSKKCVFMKDFISVIFNRKARKVSRQECKDFIFVSLCEIHSVSLWLIFFTTKGTKYNTKEHKVLC
jgi:hypothetical protein